MKRGLQLLPRAADRCGLIGMIVAKMTCMLGMHLSLLLGLLGASGMGLPLLEPINRILGPISLPLFLVSLGLMLLGSLRRGPVALALVAGGGLLLYAAVYAHGMNLPLYSLAMIMLLAPFLAGPLSRRLHRRSVEASNGGDIRGVAGE